MATIYFDMDGTLAGLFFVKDFSKKLSGGDMSPYTDAKTLYNAEEMAEVVSALKAKGFSIGVISYADAENLEKATEAKMNWLGANFPYADAEKIHIVTKATAKESFYNDGDILVDDAKANREAWEKVGGTSINAYFKAPVKMIDALKALI
jgi:5'(3')-deoxyribonucleotidase